MTIDKTKNPLPDVSVQFISENQNVNTKKKGGPYNKKERNQRKNKVYQLYFEHGYPALKISEILQVNRNTVNSDIKYWYSKLAKEWNDYNIESRFAKQMKRLEAQRTRLYEQLGSLVNLKEKLAVERFIFEIDTMITQHESKMATSQDQMVQKVAEMLNKEAEKKNFDVRFFSTGQIISVSAKTGKAIENLIKEGV